MMWFLFLIIYSFSFTHSLRLFVLQTQALEIHYIDQIHGSIHEPAFFLCPQYWEHRHMPPYPADPQFLGKSPSIFSWVFDAQGYYIYRLSPIVKSKWGNVRGTLSIPLSCLLLRTWASLSHPLKAMAPTWWFCGERGFHDLQLNSLMTISSLYSVHSI